MALIVNFPSCRMYWADSKRLESVSDVMSRNRFDTTRKNFYIKDNSTIKAHDYPEYV